MPSVRVTIEAPAAAAAPERYASPCVVQLFRQPDGATRAVSWPGGGTFKKALLGGAAGSATTPAASARVAGDWPRTVAVEVDESGIYAAIAFVVAGGSRASSSRDARLDFAGGVQPLAWLTADGGFGGKGSTCAIDAECVPLTLTLRHATPPPATDERVECGARGVRNGCNILHLWGGARARGKAQGLLLGRQIVDFLEFFIIEDAVGGTAQYQVLHAAFASPFFAVSEEFRSECEGMVEGIRQSTGDGGMVRALGRIVDAVDIVCVNAPTLIGMTLREYAAGRLPLSIDAPDRAVDEEAVAELQDGECSQFAAWGAATEGTDVCGGTIVGRNMDGECDVRKVTVSHFLLLAVETDAVVPGPYSERDGRRYISALWPGGIGVQTGLNSRGLWRAGNAGSPLPAPFLEGESGGGKGHPLNSAAIQHLLKAPLPPSPPPADVLAALHEVSGPTGGIRVSGQCLMIAQPYDPANKHGGGFVYEGDHKGGQIRTVANDDIPPHQNDALMVTNHNLLRGCEAPFGGPDGAGPESVFGRAVGFNTRARYHAGATKLAALRRAGRAIGTEQMKSLLQAVAGGMTEHSVIVRPNAMELEVAFGNLGRMWDAPYSEWHRFHFNECFIAGADVGTPRL